MKVRFAKDEGSKINNLYDLEDKISFKDKEIDKLSSVLHIKQKREKLYKISLICITSVNAVLLVSFIYKEELMKWVGAF